MFSELKMKEAFQRFLLMRREGHNTNLARAARILRRIMHHKGMVDKRWLKEKSLELDTRNKIKVGFGPLLSLCEDETTIGVRKYRIDPIIDHINATSSKYTCGVFFDQQDMDHFDIIILVKLFDCFEYSHIAALKEKGKKIIYDIVDNPCNFRPTRLYDDSPRFMKMMDFILASSPLHFSDLESLSIPIELVPHPIINEIDSNDRIPEKNNDDIRLLWQGYSHNIGSMHSIHPMIKRISASTGKNVKIIYHTNAKHETGDCYEVWPWHICDWKSVPAQMDIGVVIKNVTDTYQKRKPSNKILSYMAAGLAIVCQASPADELVLEQGVTGFMVQREEDWEAYLLELVANDAKRIEMGRAARRYAVQNFSIQKICAQYEAIFDRLFTN